MVIFFEATVGFGAGAIGAVVGAAEAVGSGVEVATGVGVGVAAGAGAGGASWLNFTLIVGLENVKPLAARYKKLLDSRTVVVTIALSPLFEIILMVALIGALVNPYKQRAYSDWIARS